MSSTILPQEPTAGENSELQARSDLRDLVTRFRTGLYQTVSLALIGFTVAALGAIFLSRALPVATTMRVVFSFPGMDTGKYPDKSKFQAEDLRSPAILSDAIKRVGLDDSSEFRAKIAAALSIEGIIPPNIVKERDRLRASGQTPPQYVPVEYIVSLTLRRSISLSDRDRARLLNEVVNVYRDNFFRTYGLPPVAFGSAFDTLRSADFPEYEIIFNSEMENIRSYLSDQQDAAKSYRSRDTNLSFKDLTEQADLFAEIQLNEVLGLIHENGLSRNRTTAMMKMDYYLRLLGARENQASEDEKVVRDLLTQSQQHAQNYVLGIKTQAAQPRTEEPILDQGLIDSLLANDAYNFLIRRALDAGLEVKKIQGQRERLANLRDNMKTFLQSASTDQTAAMGAVDKSLHSLEENYSKLIDRIRRTQADFARQQYADSIQVSDSPRTDSLIKPLITESMVGLLLGFLLGTGLSLLGFYIGKQERLV